MSESQAGKGERVAKLLARAGLCSRRDAERWIAEGRVALHGEVLTSPAVNVSDPAALTVDGKPLPQPERARLWRYHKPTGLVTTHRDEKGRATVFDALPKDLPRLISVGRLDLNSEGLLLLTNDGALARRLELPANGWIRRYKVRVHGTVDPAQLDALAKGVTIDGVAYGAIEASFEREQRSNAWLTISLREGRNREVRKVMAHLGLDVSRLIRLAYGPFQLGHLPRGAIEEVPLRVLRAQLGGKEPHDDSGHAKPRERPERTGGPHKQRQPKQRPPKQRPPKQRLGKRAPSSEKGRPTRGKGGDAHHRR